MTLEVLEKLVEITNKSYAELDAKRSDLYNKLKDLDEQRKELQAEIEYTKKSMKRVEEAHNILTGKEMIPADDPADEVERHGPFEVEKWPADEEEEVTSWSGLR